MSEITESILRGAEDALAYAQGDKKRGHAHVAPLGAGTDLSPRSPGRLKGELQETSGLDQTPEEIIKAFEGE